MPTARLSISYTPEDALPLRLERIRRELGARSLSAAVRELVERFESASERRGAQPDPEPKETTDRGN